MSADTSEAIALFHYAVMSAATNPRLSPAKRGQLVRELASQAYAHPGGSKWTCLRVTLDRCRVVIEPVAHAAPLAEAFSWHDDQIVVSARPGTDPVIDAGQEIDGLSKR